MVLQIVTQWDSTGLDRRARGIAAALSVKCLVLLLRKSTRARSTSRNKTRGGQTRRMGRER
jgi:hypothetical protein